MKIKKFNESSSSKAAKLEGNVKLYRLASHSVIDLSNPGDFYFTSKSSIDPEILTRKGKDLYLITVKTDSSNIDIDKSEKECAKRNINDIVVVKNDKKCEVIKAEPFKN